MNKKSFIKTLAVVLSIILVQGTVSVSAATINCSNVVKISRIYDGEGIGDEDTDSEDFDDEGSNDEDFDDEDFDDEDFDDEDFDDEDFDDEDFDDEDFDDEDFDDVIEVPKVDIKKIEIIEAKKVKFTFNKNENLDGYEITYSTKKSFKSSDTKTKVIKNKKKYTLSNLPKKENYIKLRGYILNEDGEKIYGDYSKAIKVIIK